MQAGLVGPDDDRPASAGPSQTCCPPIHKFPEARTTRSTSTACSPLWAWTVIGSGASTGTLCAGRGSGLGWGGFGSRVGAASWAGTRSSNAGDLERFVFLLAASDGEPLFGP